MPELPEVETVRRGLLSLITGKTVKLESHDTGLGLVPMSSVSGLSSAPSAAVSAVNVTKSTPPADNNSAGQPLNNPAIERIGTQPSKGFPNTPGDVNNFLLGATITDVRRRAKVLLIDLSTSYTLVIHLKMTGQMVYRGEQVFGAGHPNNSLIGSLPDKSTRVTLMFTDGSNLYFNDQRKFGWMRLLPTIEVPNIDFMKKVGPEPLEDSFTPTVFIERVRMRANTTIKAAILDQTVLAGIGNIYADEGLWGAKIHPGTRVRDITDKQLKVLHKELQFVLRLSIEKGGSTDRNYVNAEGIRGSYIDFARVFRREGKDCPRHPGTIIIKTRVAGRGTHTCPKCQKF